MLDYPDYFKTGYISLLKNPDLIKNVGISFNDDYDLESMDIDVTEQNFRKYIFMRSKHKLLHQIKNRDDLDTYDRFKALVSGFNEVRKFFGKEKATLSAIDKLLTFETVNKNTIQLLVDKLKLKHITNNVSEEILTKIILYENIISILQDEGNTFPYEVVNLQPPSDEESRLRNFYEFIERLLSFWSGFRHFSNETPYTLRVISKLGPEKDTTDDTLPLSHTCYHMIDIPIQYYNDRTKLYSKLVQAVYFGEKIVGLYGGSKKKTQYKFIRKNSIASKTIYKSKKDFFIQENKQQKKLFKKGGNSTKFVAVFCSNSDTIKDKSMILMKSIFPDYDIIYTPMGIEGDQKCKVNVTSRESVLNFLSDVECSNLPMYAKFDAIIFENCPIMGIFQKEFFNENSVNTWKMIIQENAPFYLGFFTDKNLEGIDFTKHNINNFMKQTNHFRIMDDSKDLNVFEYRLL
jgi:hypothetical protein